MADRDTYRLKAFDTIIEWSKQILTFAAAILVLSATFVRTIVPNRADVVGEFVLFLAWFALLSSIVAGVVFMGRVAHTLDAARKTEELDIWKSQTIGLCQFIFFFAGIVTFLWFVYCNLTNHDRSRIEGQTTQTLCPPGQNPVIKSASPPSVTPHQDTTTSRGVPYASG